MIKLLKNNINIITEIYKYYHLKKKRLGQVATRAQEW